MKARSTLTAGAVISSVFGVLIGNFIKNMSGYFSLSDLINIIFAVFGVLSIISGLPSLIYGISFFALKSGKVSFFSSLVNLAFGAALIFYHSDILLFIACAYLVIFPLCQIIFTRKGNERRSVAKALAPRIIIGILIIAFFPITLGLADTVFSLILSCVGWAIIVISLIFLAVSLFALYINPLFSKKSRKDSSTIYLGDEDFNEKNK